MKASRRYLWLLLSWMAYNVLGYCAIAGFAWWWVLGMRYPVWRLLVVAGIYTVIQLASNIFYPRLKDALAEREKQGGAT